MQKLLVIGKTWPEPKTTGAGRRMLQILSALTTKYQVHFASAAQKSDFSESFDGLPVRSHTIHINNNSFDTFLKEINPDTVVFDRFHTEEQFGWRVAECLPHALRILNMEDFHGLRSIRRDKFSYGELEKDQTELLQAAYLNETVLREIAAIFRCDRTWVISEKEQKLLNELSIPDYLLYYLPFKGVDFCNKKGFETGFSDRSNMVFFGNFFHAPNIDAIDALRSVWPKIHSALPLVELHIYGAYGERIAVLQNLPKGMIYKGWIDNLNIVLNDYRVLLAPLRFGAGIKTKILEAIGSGLPVISTPIGWEGICDEEHLLPGVSCVQENSIIAAALTLYSSEGVWYKTQKKSALWMNLQAKDWDGILLHQIHQDWENLKENRTKNIVGGILQLNCFKTYKYLSKYIMAKNDQK
ncbi:MAG: glycosyltransferase family 4 protein [Crocinitomicaceae bacterium]|nr:glycosyltransferase family 4 protein [Crocinitomicaceae bacterium]